MFFHFAVQTASSPNGAVVFCATHESIEGASELMDRAIRNYFRGDLECRSDIDTAGYLKKLKAASHTM